MASSVTAPSVTPAWSISTAAAAMRSMNSGRRFPRALCGLLRSRFWLCRCRREGLARGAGSALARGAVHPRTRPDRRPAGVRENARPAGRPVRPAHRLELSGPGPEAEQAFSGVAVIARSVGDEAIQSSRVALDCFASLAMTLLRLTRRRLLRRRHAPHRVADIVGDQERALLVDLDADRTALGFALVVEEAGQHVLRRARRLAVGERHKNHLVAGAGFSVPGAVLADEGTIGHLGWKQIAGVEGQSE